MTDKKNGAVPEKKIKSELIYDGKVLRLLRDTVYTGAGKEAIREVIRHNGAVCVIPLDSDGCVICEMQYRYAQGRVILEIPAGKLDSPNEDPEAAAKRELAEETGYRAGKMVYLGIYLGSPAILDERIHMFAALELAPGQTHRDDDEFIEILRIPLEELVKMVTSGEIPDGKTQASVLRLYYMKEHGII